MLATFEQLFNMLSVNQASFDHEKVSARPFFLTKTLIFFVFDMLAIFVRLTLEDITNTHSLTPVGGFYK